MVFSNVCLGAGDCSGNVLCGGVGFGCVDCGWEVAACCLCQQNESRGFRRWCCLQYRWLSAGCAVVCRPGCGCYRRVVSLATVVVRQTVPERLKNPLTVRASVAGLCRREIGLTFGWRPGICPCGPRQPPQSRSQCPPVRRVLSA
jgi:hypothetical protein